MNVDDRLSPRAANWGTNETLVFNLAGSGDGILQISANGGTARSVTHVDTAQGETDHRHPELLPGGEALLFTVWYDPVMNRGLDDAQIVVQTLATGERKVLVSGASPRYAASGHIVFARANALWAVPFDLNRLETTGPPLPVIEGVDVDNTGGERWTPSFGQVFVTAKVESGS